MAYFHVFLLLSASVSALYSSTSSVVQLTADNFESEVLNSNNLWIVEFYAPWCGHCKNLAPEFEKAAKALKGFVKLGAVDMTVHGAVGSNYNIQGYPTLKFFGDNKKAPTDYDSGRTAKDLIAFSVKQAEAVAQKRLGLKPENKGESKSQENKKPEPEPEVQDSDVEVLTEANFESLVIGSDDLWLVEFYAPWCGHCKKLAPEWAKAATELKGSVRLGKVDATVEKSLGSRYAVQGYPTIKIFSPNAEAEEYNGGRTTESIVKTALDKLDSLGKGPKMSQLLSEEDLKSSCDRVVCILAFLPHIYDSSSEERNKYIDTLSQVAKKNRGKPVKFLWVQGGDFYQFEQLLGMGSGYPAVSGISLAKSRHALMRSSFKQEEVESFVKKLLNGNIALEEYKQLPKMPKVTPWDGKDQVQEVHNEDL
jgi:protein disulfide-isomerase A6